MSANELKYFVISDTTEKYDEINKNILKTANIYYFLIKNYSSKLNQIERALPDISIKQLLEHFHYLIKELVKIINDLLIEKINLETIKKYEEESIEIFQEPLIQKKKNIVTNKNLDMFSKSSNYYINKNSPKKEKKPKKNINISLNKNNENGNLISKKINSQKEIIPLNIISPKTNKEYNGTLSFFNININNNSNIKTYEQNSNKKKKENNKLLSLSYNNLKMMPNNIVSKNNSNHIYYNNNYTIDEELNDDYNSGNNQMQTYVTTKYNFDDESLSEYKKQRIENLSVNNSLRKEFNDKKNKNMRNNIKNEYYFKSFSHNLLNSFSNDKEDFSYRKRANTSNNLFKSNLFRNLSKNEIYCIPYVYNGKINVPSKLTKKIYNSSYKKLNNYKKKRNSSSS